MGKRIRSRLPVFVLALLLLPAYAYAKTLQFNNKTRKRIYITFIWHEEETDRWRVQGWAKVEKGETITRELETNNRYAYYYAYSSDKSIHWSGKRNDDTSISQVVVRDFMNFYRGQIPKGADRRTEWFRRIDSGEMGFWEVNLTAN